jgi:ankyrin repeat protein
MNKDFEILANIVNLNCEQSVNILNNVINNYDYDINDLIKLLALTNDQSKTQILVKNCLENKIPRQFQNIDLSELDIYLRKLIYDVLNKNITMNNVDVVINNIIIKLIDLKKFNLLYKFSIKVFPWYSNIYNNINQFIQKKINLNENTDVDEIFIKKFKSYIFDNLPSSIITDVDDTKENKLKELIKNYVNEGKINKLKISDSDKDYSLLQYATKYGNLNMVKFILNSDGIIDDKIDNELFSYALIGKNLSLVTYFVENKNFLINDASILNYKYLLMSISTLKSIDNLDISRYLVKNGINVNQKNEENQNAIQLYLKKFKNNMICNDVIDFFQLLINNGCDINNLDKNGETALFYCNYVDINMIEFLIKNGIDVNIKNNENISAILKIINHKEINNKSIYMLIENGANVNDKDNNDKTLLMSATKHLKNLELFKYLLSKGAKINAIDKNGWNAFRYSILYYNLEISKYLLDNGFNINLTNSEGWTELMDLIKYGHANFNDSQLISIINFYIINSADINAKSNDGITALKLLINNDRSKFLKNNIVKIMLENNVNLDDLTLDEVDKFYKIIQ